MSLSIPIYGGGFIDGIAGAGKYRATYSVSTWIFGTPYTVGDTRKSGSYIIQITDKKEDRIANKMAVEFIVSDNPSPEPLEANIGAGAIILGLIILGGLTLIYLSLDKVEKVIETPAGQITVIGIVLIVLALLVGGALFYYKKLRS